MNKTALNINVNIMIWFVRVEDEDPTDAIARELRQLELQDAQEESQACDFGNKRNQILEEMRKRNGPVKDSFKPFRCVALLRTSCKVACSFTHSSTFAICLTMYQTNNLMGWPRQSTFSYRFNFIPIFCAHLCS